MLKEVTPSLKEDLFLINSAAIYEGNNSELYDC